MPVPIETKSINQVEDNASVVVPEIKTREPALSQKDIFTWVKNPLSLGLIVLIFINGILCCFNPFENIDPATLPATHTWTWWATQEFLNDKPTPPVVLVGSSLFMHSVSRQDADFLNEDFDYVHHHYSAYLASQLQKRFHLDKSPVCFNFSLPGDLMSDDYMIVRGLFKGQHKPQYVILGLSLRDFVDNASNCPGTTPPFRYLRRFTEIDDIINIAFPRFWQRCDYYVGKIFYPWSKKLDIQAWTNEQTKLLLGPIAKKFCAPCLLNELDYRKHVPANLHSEVEEGMAIIKAHIPASYEANYADYKRRYGKGKNYLWMFSLQQQFFQKLVALAKEENIKLIILNMPLTKENMDLMPIGSYELYRNLLKTQANKYGFPYIDLAQNPSFNKADFYDTAHMNSSGGKKLLDIIANTPAIRL